MDSKVEVIHEELIKPSSPTPIHLRKYELSFLDQTSPNFHFPFLFFYKGCQENLHGNAKKSQLLKQSLSKALTLYYPLAGRIIENHFINCNDVGAVYKVARVYNIDDDNSSLSQIIENRAVEGLERYLPSDPVSSNSHTKTIPLLVQTNFFPCGGIVVGICFSHKFGDASSAGAFFNTWAAISRGVAIQLPIYRPPHISPPKDKMPVDINMVVSSLKVVTKTFVFNDKSLDVLKSKVISSVKDPTKFEALAAFIWNHVKEAVAESSANTRKISGIGLVMNLRTKLVPPQSGNLIGNFLRPARAITNSEQEDVVSVLRGLKEKLDAEYVEGLVGKGQEDESLKAIMAKVRNGEIEICSFTSLVHFKFYETDFGWGKPDWVSNVTSPLKNIVLLMRTSSGDGIEAWVHLLHQDMAFLERNSEFLSMTTTFNKNSMSKL